MSFEIPKKIETFRSPFYYDCVKQYECIVCMKLFGKKNKRLVAPHHVDGRGRADVGGDNRIVPVCQNHHPQSPKAFKIFCCEHLLDAEDLIRETQQRFCEEHGYKIGRDGDTLEEILIRAGLGERFNPGKKVSNGTAESKGKKLSRLRPLSRTCGTPDHPLTHS